ncbi:glycoside hydrolase family 127 protein [Flavobacterium sp.]|uniref:glycoside hydrolase family 127 protein n=1 Tax=Flavobacterium sp. TaxID=239 RepID=UPI001B664193|nr:glycoside hydrolase family 127 protein [Flavobacterium sp.]MBP6182046.1 glycoside hydrolase family 127 protein [Flavobacterium sp.]MBP6374385.1 glycoside hydrolase family 127 protein [Flavobacterium sp.]
MIPNSIKKSFWLGLVLVSTAAVYGQSSQLQSFPLSSVRLLEGPFKAAQETDMNYILALDSDRLLAPYFKEAGIESKAINYPNWENTGLDGHIGGHYLSALSEMYAATGNQQIKERLDYMLNGLEKCQQKNGNGYIGGVPGSKELWEEIAKGKIDAGSFSLNNKWVPWYNIHKVYAGLVDAYTLTGNEKAKKMLIQLSDWCLNLTATLSDDQIQQMLRSEHGGMNEVFADVAAITGDKKYLVLARKFSHKAILDPLLKDTDALNGIHANTQIPKVIGFMRVAEVSRDKEWANAAKFFWNTVVNNRTISIGGNSVREHFNPTTDFSSMLESREGPETCNSYNMLKLSKHLFLADPSSRYMDYYERTTYNHILSSQHPDGGFVYFTPIRPRHYRVYSESQQSFWCCVGSGLENHGKYGELIYAHDKQNLYVNLFIPSTLNWKEKGITLTQNTKFPFEEQTSIRLTLKKPQQFAIKFRYPSWVEDGKMKITVNNKAIGLTKDVNSYVSIERKWKTGDVIAVVLPMQNKTEQLPDKSAWVSFVHGPIVLAAITDTTDLVGLRADDSRMGHIANGQIYPIEDAPLLVSNNTDLATSLKAVSNKPFTFSASDIIYQEKYKNLQLVPFFQIHDARYMLYWPYTTKEKLPEIQKAMKEREEAQIKLEALTVDVVTAGEQQPESDHNFKGDKTDTGIFKERHYRNGQGSFSYDLKNNNLEARKLRVTYFGADKNRNFDIYVNTILVASMNMDGSEGNQFIDKIIELPETILNGKPKILEVQFKAKPNSTITGIYEVRLLK